MCNTLQSYKICICTYIHIHKRNNTVNTLIHITKTPTQSSTHPHIHTPTYYKTKPQYKIHSKYNSHNTIKYHQYKVTLMCMVILSPNIFNVTRFTSLQNKITSHISRQFTPHHYTSHHFTYLHSTPTWIPLPVTTFATLFLKVFRTAGERLQWACR